MIKISVTPREQENLYGLMVKKELELRKKNQGTLHRYASKKKNEARWLHKSYKGWINLQKCLGGMVVATVKSHDRDAEWQLLTSFIGFLDRHFGDYINNINLTYERPED
jgi:hypothetical protein